jgi:chromatin segregation and condensation protein Rec8/ScpA/Scc1 (kleisin family)
MAWKILKLQSDDLVLTMKKQEENYEPFGWGDIPTEMWLSQDDDYSYTNIVMNMPEPPLNEPIRRNAKRKVTLIELIEAFNLARKESENYILIEKQRREERERIEEKARKRMKGTTHEDHIEEDVEVIWRRIQSIPERKISILDLCENDNKDEIIKVLMSILFLVYDNKIDVIQKKFPFGDIYIKNLKVG